MLDLRFPTGAFFGMVGILLVAMGLLAPDTRAPLTEANVNLYCGLVMLAFGGLMLGLAWRARPRT
ncbi:MAG TPA: hypothetical protein VGF59_29670 [Bryobacteraceae bacterium]|jgi:uncharacterized membrane protein